MWFYSFVLIQFIYLSWVMTFKNKREKEKLDLFFRKLLQKNELKGSIRPCTPCCPGFWRGANPQSSPSGATYPKTTTPRATPSCRRCWLTCIPVCNVLFFQKLVIFDARCSFTAHILLSSFYQEVKLQVPKLKTDHPEFLTARKGAMKTVRQTPAILPRQAMQVISQLIM